MLIDNNNYSSSSSSCVQKICPIIRGYPFIGILLNLIINNPLRFLQQIARKYPGEVISMNVGPIRTYLVTHPDHVQHVLKTNWQNYSKGKLMWDAARMVIGDSVATNDGESWIRSRRLMQPIFTVTQVGNLTELMVKIVANEIERLDEISKSDSIIHMDKEMMLFGQSIMLGTIFGSSLDYSKRRAIADALDVAARTISLRIFLSFLPNWIPLPGNHVLRKALQTIDSSILSIILERRKSTEIHYDLLSRLMVAFDAETHMSMTNQQLRDECVTIFLGGFDTTSRALTWLWHMFNEHPHIEQKVRAEVDTVLGKSQPNFDDLDKLRYTKMTIHETLRQHPTTWLMPRFALAADTIDGYPIEAGSTILLSPYITNYLSEFWTQPEAFDPERFAPEKAIHHHPYAQFTFGGGPRHCIGKYLALLQMQLIVVMVIQKFRPCSVSKKPVQIRPGINLQLRNSLKMRLEKA
jgi:cytochrome P450